VGIDAHIAQLKNQRHDLLENAKRKGVTLPQQGESEEAQVETQGKLKQKQNKTKQTQNKTNTNTKQTQNKTKQTQNIFLKKRFRKTRW